MGLEGWSRSTTVPYFRSSSATTDFEGPAHGATAEFPCAGCSETAGLGFTTAVHEASQAEGFPVREDLNADFADGCFPMTVSNQYDSPVSTAVSYLDPATRRRLVSRILADTLRDRPADGGAQGHRRHAAWRRLLAGFEGGEVILSAGAAHSPRAADARGDRAGRSSESRGRRRSPPICRAWAAICWSILDQRRYSSEARGTAAGKAGRAISSCGLRYSSHLDDCPQGDMFLLPANRAGWHPAGQAARHLLS